MRVKRGKTSHKKHKKILKAARGYRMTRHKLIKVAKESLLHAGQYAYAGRKRKKRDFRRLWITRISEATKRNGLSYSKFIAYLKKENIALNRKILSDLIVSDEEVFKTLLDKIRKV